MGSGLCRKALRSVGRSLGRGGAGEKDLSTDGESDWLEEGGTKRGKEREIKGPLGRPIDRDRRRGPLEITLDSTTHVRYGPGINLNGFGCKSEPTFLKKTKTSIGMNGTRNLEQHDWKVLHRDGRVITAHIAMFGL